MPLIGRSKFVGVQLVDRRYLLSHSLLGSPG